MLSGWHYIQLFHLRSLSLSLSLSRYVDDDVDSSSDEHDRIFEEDGIQVKDQVLGACTNKIESFFVSFLDK